MMCQLTGRWIKIEDNMEDEKTKDSVKNLCNCKLKLKK